VSAAESTAHGEAPVPDEEGAAPDDLLAVVRELSDRIEALQADVRRLGGPGLPQADAVWEGDEPEPVTPSYAWVSSVSAPVRRRPAIPRLLLEVLFLAAVATAAGVADLEAGAIAGVMAGAWVLVALIEWAAARAERRRDEIPAFERLPATSAAGPLPPDAAWFVPPVEQTLVETPESQTAVTLLPPAVQDIDATVERPPG
jgi:hypothetical protein